MSSDDRRMDQAGRRQRPLVSVVEDDADTNRAVCGLAEAHDWEAAGFPDAVSFLAGYDGGRAGCIVLDLRLPDASGLQVVEALAERREHVSPVIFVTGHGDLQTAVTAMKQELVLDFIEKPFEPADLVRVMEAAIVHDLNVVGSWRTWETVRERLARLSERERQVLDALMKGKSNKLIALELDVSHKTISTHRTNVLEKFDCQSIVDVARLMEAPRPGTGNGTAVGGDETEAADGGVNDRANGGANGESDGRGGAATAAPFG